MSERTIDLPAWIRRVVAIDPDASALQFEGEWWTWDWIGRAIDDFAALTGLDAAGGVKVGVVMSNRPEIIGAVTAVLAGRHCLVTLSPAIPAAELAAEIERLRLPVVVASAGRWDSSSFVDAVRAAGSLGVVARPDGDPFTVAFGGTDRLAEPGDTAPGVAIEMLTSGTTGPPKRIDLSYRGLEHEIESTAQYSKTGALGEPRSSSGTALVWTALVHIGGLRGLITALVAGRRIALLERFSVDGWAALVREHRPNVVSLVPAALTMVLDADLPRDTFEGVVAVFAGTAELDPELGRQFEERYGPPVLVVYGATEFAGGVAGWTLADWRRFGADKIGSVGRPNAGVAVRVVDQESGHEVPHGDVGLLEVSAAQLSRPGWVRTTDLARVDDDDFIWIVGRVDDVIVRGGFKVATNAVRDVLVQHPAVAEAAVVGRADRRLGHVPVAAVELRADVAAPSGDDLLVWLRERLSAYQVPVEVRVVDELPRTPSMKVSQGRVKELLADGA